MNKKWIIANWKMNALRVDSIDCAMTLIENLPSNKKLPGMNYRVVLCPPLCFLNMLDTLCQDSMLMLGAQDCHTELHGSYTGGVSAEMIRDIGGTLVIVGHSERRAAGDNDATIKAKAKAVVRAKLLPVICVGEDVHARAVGRDKDMVIHQLLNNVPDEAKNVLIAYEPIWAIGTGKAADEHEIAEMFTTIAQFMKKQFPHIRFALCYGGSVVPSNAASLANIEGCSGLLVGSASLNAHNFLEIIRAV